jgi:predicted GH43/DUF377 family glycosyl hydrolase
VESRSQRQRVATNASVVKGLHGYWGMRWHKLGLLYVPDGSKPWARTHAMIPTPLWLSDDIIRLYVGHLDEHSVGRIGYVEVRASDPTQPLVVSERPVLDIGAPGTFDDNGVVPSCIVRGATGLQLYYSGFQIQTKVPYTIFSSVAIANAAGEIFTRASVTPLLDHTESELFFRAAPFVLYDEGHWRMWYIGGSSWTDGGNGKLLPSYSLCHTQSRDGLDWRNPSVECLAPNGPEEIGFGRPFVLRQKSDYRMWYSIRKRTGYALGYAESTDGLNWVRRDDAVGIACSDRGWDSEMICYAAVVPANGRYLMFYNGNGYGRTGVGVAVAD